MPEQNLAINDIREYNNHKIHLNADWRLTISGPEFAEDERRGRKIIFNSFHDACEEINNRISDSEKIRAKDIKLNETVINSAGQRINITSIDRRSGEIAGVEGRVIYPDINWIRQGLLRRKILHAEIYEIDKSLKEVEISVARSYGRINAEDYGEKIAKLKSQLEAAKAKADELYKLQMEVSKTITTLNFR